MTGSSPSAARVARGRRCSTGGVAWRPASRSRSSVKCRTFRAIARATLTSARRRSSRPIQRASHEARPRHRPDPSASMCFSRSGQIELRVSGETRSSSSSPSITCQGECQWNQGDDVCVSARNQDASALPISSVDGAARRRVGGLVRSRRADRVAQPWGHSVADLLERRGRRTSEPEPVREGLDPSRLADGQCAVLLGVDVPVAVLGDVRRDRPRDVVAREPLVLVVEDVVAVALQVLGRSE